MRKLLEVPFEELKIGDAVELPSGERRYITEIFSDKSIVVTHEDGRSEILLSIEDDYPKSLIGGIIYIGPPKSTS